jgi:molybdopterin/thiamine biosynthesis adenylyltransferase
LIPALLRTVRNHADPNSSPDVVLVDGDTIEVRNMERQLFTDADIGKNKAVAIANANKEYYPTLGMVGDFFSGDEPWIATGALVIACVDNHPGRARVLAAADRVGGEAIICGNGYTDAEAMFYSSMGMRDTPRDPRVMFPEILTDHADDPLARGSGCTGEAQQQTPQLAIANFMAAAYALHLMWFHYQEIDKLDREFRGHSPLRHASNASRISTLKLQDAK